MVVDFLKSFVFKDKKESDFKSKDFNGFKFSIFMLLVFFIAIEIYTVIKLYNLAVQNIELTESLEKCKK